MAVLGDLGQRHAAAVARHVGMRRATSLAAPGNQPHGCGRLPPNNPAPCAVRGAAIYATNRVAPARAGTVRQFAPCRPISTRRFSAAAGSLLTLGAFEPMPTALSMPGSAPFFTR